MFSRWPLTVRGTGAAVLAVLCLVLAQRFALAELLYLAVLLVLLVAGSIATLYLVRRTERVTRSFDPAVVPVGGEVVVGLRVEIRSALPAAQGQWQDALPTGVHGDATGVFPQTTSGVRVKGHDAQLAYTATAERRGIRNIGPLSVVATDPFGLARRHRTIGRALPLTITPALVELGVLADRSGDLGGGMHTATDQLGQGADNLIPRHYVPGDSMRRIHWRASAHRDELMVRQEEQETTPEAVVVLDRTAAHWSVDATRAPGTDDRFEAAVSACLSVAARLGREGYTVAVLDGDGAALSDAIDAGDTTGIERLAIDLATVKARREGSLGGSRRPVRGRRDGSARRRHGGDRRGGRRGAHSPRPPHLAADAAGRDVDRASRPERPGAGCAAARRRDRVAGGRGRRGGGPRRGVERRGRPRSASCRCLTPGPTRLGAAALGASSA